MNALLNLDTWVHTGIESGTEVLNFSQMCEDLLDLWERWMAQEHKYRGIEWKGGWDLTSNELLIVSPDITEALTEEFLENDRDQGREWMTVFITQCVRAGVEQGLRMMQGQLDKYVEIVKIREEDRTETLRRRAEKATLIEELEAAIDKTLC